MVLLRIYDVALSSRHTAPLSQSHRLLIARLYELRVCTYLTTNVERTDGHPEKSNIRNPIISQVKTRFIENDIVPIRTRAGKRMVELRCSNEYNNIHDVNERGDRSLETFNKRNRKNYINTDPVSEVNPLSQPRVILFYFIFFFFTIVCISHKVFSFSGYYNFYAHLPRIFYTY